jgi:hypothetical protein
MGAGSSTRGAGTGVVRRDTNRGFPLGSVSCGPRVGTVANVVEYQDEGEEGLEAGESFFRPVMGLIRRPLGGVLGGEA